MGITGLLPNLSDFSKSLNVSKLKHTTAAIDTYCWIHKGLYLSVGEVLDGKEPTKFLHLIDNYITMLKLNNITPILTFDGGSYPFKAETDLKRSESRKKAKEEAFSVYEKTGDKAKAAAILKTAMSVTKGIHDSTIAHCKEKGYNYVVAPYECDAQLAYLFKEGYADFVISEDSDLFLFGVTNLMTKMNSEGDGVYFQTEGIFNSPEIKPKYSSRTKKLLNLNFTEFLSVCALTGCDYIPNKIKNVGFVKGLDFVNSTNGCSEKIMEKILEAEKYTIPEDWKERFEMALLSWKFHPVFCLKKKRVVSLNKIEGENEEGKRYWEKFSLENLNELNEKLKDNEITEKTIKEGKNNGEDEEDEKNDQIFRERKGEEVKYLKKVKSLKEMGDKLNK